MRVAVPNGGQGGSMLWLIIGIVLLVIAIAGGAIIHPILFVLAILALVAFVTHFRSPRTY
jgi:membrane protein implicated in regulation of membrane protease activity